MLFLFGGIPEVYFNRLKDRAARELSSDNFTGLPLYPAKSGTYAIDQKYCQELVNTLVAYIENRPLAIDDGMGVILLQRPWDLNHFEPNFLPFGLCRVQIVDGPIRRTGTFAKQAANMYASAALEAANQLRKPVRALASELTTRLRRTPLLLPLRHFNSVHLQRLIDEIVNKIHDAILPHEAIKAACRSFETHHPFEKRGQGGRFENPKGVKFTAPPRNEFHGHRPGGGLAST